MALLTLTGVSMAVRCLLALPRCAQNARGKAAWQLLPGILWAFVPALMLLWGVPSLTLRFAARVFDFVNTNKSMLDIFIWLVLIGVLGVINGGRADWCSGAALRQNQPGAAAGIP